MGLIRASLTAFNSTMADQWKEYFTADALDNDVIMVRGHIQTTDKSSNKRGESEIITEGSAISVNEGQAMIIVDNGEIIDFCAEPGVYTFSEGENSLFVGGLGQSIKETFNTFKKRFTFGGDTGRNTRVYYFNTKALFGQKFGTTEPLTYDDPVYKSISIRFFGQAELKLSDPILFYKKIAGNVEEKMTITDLWTNQLKSEFMMNINQTFALLANDNVKYNQIAQQQTKIAAYMNECLDEEWVKNRGIVVESVGITNITLAPEDKDKIDKIDEMHLMSDTTNAAGRMTSAMANALEGAAENEGGAFMGFAGMNAAQGAGGAQINNLHQMAKEEKQQEANSTVSSNSWTCSCGTVNTGKFCTECGTAKQTSWTCSCGTENTGKFCTECGKAKQTSWTCSCGTENTGKFCTECGKSNA